jgi:hypothetical protein
MFYEGVVEKPVIITKMMNATMVLLVTALPILIIAALKCSVQVYSLNILSMDKVLVLLMWIIWARNRKKLCDNGQYCRRDVPRWENCTAGLQYLAQINSSVVLRLRDKTVHWCVQNRLLTDTLKQHVDRSTESRKVASPLSQAVVAF